MPTTKKITTSIAQREGDCPRCGQSTLKYGAMELHDIQLHYPYTCTNCEFRGHEWYQLEFIEHTDEDDNSLTEVDMIAAGYEWCCPLCNTFNKEIEIKERVICKKCKRSFAVNEVNHANQH